MKRHLLAAGVAAALFATAAFVAPAAAQDKAAPAAMTSEQWMQRIQSDRAASSCARWT